MPSIPEPGFLKDLPNALGQSLGTGSEFAADLLAHALIICEPATCGIATAIISPFTEFRYGLTAVEIHAALAKTADTALRQIKQAITSDDTTAVDLFRMIDTSGEAAEAELIVMAQSRANPPTETN